MAFDFMYSIHMHFAVLVKCKVISSPFLPFLIMSSLPSYGDNWCVDSGDILVIK